MPSVLAVVSKKIFEAQALRGKKLLGLGEVFGTARYVSTHPALAAMKGDGDLFLVTVRPPDEHLWLVAVLRTPSFDGQGWGSEANAVPITDISSLRPHITFANGAKVTTEKGKLGMSLQTPRVLSPESVALLQAAASGTAAPPQTTAAPAIATKKPPLHLNKHERQSPLPCLCKRCLRSGQDTVTVNGLEVVRLSATADERIFYFWMPKELAAQSKDVVRAVEGRLREMSRQVKR